MAVERPTPDRLIEILRQTDEAGDILCGHAADEIARLHAVNDRLRLAINRLAMQDATLSVCDGNVTVTMDATLTDAEREAVEWFAAGDETCYGWGWKRRAETLRGLLERLK